MSTEWGRDDPVVTDAQIAAMSPEQRHDLVRRLQTVAARPFLPERTLRRVRRVRLGVMTTGTAVLIPWIVVLAVSLPDSYEAHNWPVTWVGFDIALVGMMLATVTLGVLRRQVVMLSAFSTGVMLVCDAWFDVMTSAPEDRWWSIAAAVCAELPLAALLTIGSMRLMRLNAVARGVLGPGERLWSLRIPLVGDTDPAGERGAQ